VAAEEEEREQEEPELEEGEEAEGEGEGEEEGRDPTGGGGRKRGGARAEEPRERWRECALYREAQRHMGTPSARKTHRQLGIFGLRGFPAEVEHTRDFVPPGWALPRDDPRFAQRIADMANVVEKPRRGGGARMGVVVGVTGVGSTGEQVGQAIRNVVVITGAGTEDREETQPEVGVGNSDPVAVVSVETPKTVDSQETEDLMLSESS